MASLQTARSQSAQDKLLTPFLYLVKPILLFCVYLHRKGPKNNRTEDGVPKNAVKDIPLSVDFSGIYFIKELHHDEGVEYDGVVFRGRRVEGSVTATVNVKDLLTYTKEGGQLNGVKYNIHQSAKI